MSEADRSTGPSRPTIVITGPDRGGWPAWIFTAWAVWRAGGKPRRATPARPRLPEPLHGVILGGGADVGPGVFELLEDGVAEPRRPETGSPVRRWWRYACALGRTWLDRLVAPMVVLLRWLGARPPDAGRRTDERRDQLETRVLGRAERDRLPVLGICRGAQLMNRFRGGTLVQNLSGLYEERPQMRTVLPRRPIEVDVPSRMYDALGRHRLLVNSLHQHAVGDPGRGLRIVAREPDGIVQGIESIDDPPWLGVQWHPEYLPQIRAQRGLFEALVGVARRCG